MLGGKIEITVFDNHICHTYPSGSPYQYEWERIKKDIVEALKPPHNSESKAITLLNEWVSDNGCTHIEYRDLVARTKLFLLGIA